MKETVNPVVRGIVLLCVFSVASMASARMTYVWNPNGSGGWQAPGQYFAADGATAAVQAPTADDLVKIPADTTVTVATDADAAFVNTLAGVELTDATSKFVFNQPSDIQWGCAVFGSGEMIKCTEATVELLANTQTDLYEKQFDGFSAYCTWGGLTLEKGVFKMPQSDSGGIYSLGPVTMAEDATLFLDPSNRTQMAALDGYGVVTNTFNIGNGTELQIGYVNYADQRASRFYGKLTGGIRWYACGTVYLYGTSSTFSGWTFMQWGRYTENSVVNGHLYLSRFGRNGQASSIGATYNWTLESRIGGAFHYLGEGEATNKKFAWTPYANAAGALMDAGANGGVTFENDWNHVSIGSGELMARLQLDGSNAAPCIVSGKVTTPSGVATYFTKTGSGTWCFANDANAYNGVLAVKDGTFQFTSIAEAGSPSALGLSEILHDSYIGARDDSRVVDYAFLLGSAGKLPALEYIGGKAAFCSTRALALTGDGGKLVSSGEGSELRFVAGVSSLDAGEKTLVLGGDSAGYNVISNIASGNGSVAVAKEGSGRWIISGKNTLSGKLDVREGRLELWDRYAGERYTWYRLVVKKLKSAKMAYVPEFALYDATGSNRVAGLKYRVPAEYANGISQSYVSFDPVPTSELNAGEALFYSANGSKVYHYYDKSSNLQSLFDGTASKWRMNIVSNLPNGTEERYIYVVMRLPEDTPPIVRYDINVGEAKTSADIIEKFAVECSNDGENWKVLTDDVTVAAADAWASGDEFAEGHPLRPGKGLEFSKIFFDYDADGSTMLDNVTSVQVAAGATLAAKGVSKMIDNLTLDCTAGAGTLEGFEFASSGTINLVNIPEKAVDFTVPVKFGKVSAASLANINTWSVSVNGKPSSHWDVKVTADTVSGTKRGMCIIVR